MGLEICQCHIWRYFPHVEEKHFHCLISDVLRLNCKTAQWPRIAFLCNVMTVNDGVINPGWMLKHLNYRHNHHYNAVCNVYRWRLHNEKRMHYQWRKRNALFLEPRPYSWRVWSCLWSWIRAHLSLSFSLLLSLISLCPSPRFALRPTLREAFLSNFLLSVSSLSAEFRFGDGKLHKQFPPPAVEPFCPGSVWTPFQFPESILHRYFLPSYRPRLLTSPSLSFCVLVTVPV